MGELDSHPFIVRLLRCAKLSAADLKSFGTIIDGDSSIRRRHDLIIDGSAHRELGFVKDGYAVRYKLLRNGKRQIVNVLLPGDVVGLLGSFYDRAAYSVTAVTNLTVNMCSLDAYMQLCYQRPQFALALCWVAVQEANTYAEHIVNLGRRTPIERLSHFLLEIQARLSFVGCAEDESFALPFSQEIIADVLGLSVPHLNKMIQQLRSDKLIANTDGYMKFLDKEMLKTLAHYQPQELTSIPQSHQR